MIKAKLRQPSGTCQGLFAPTGPRTQSQAQVSRAPGHVSSPGSESSRLRLEQELQVYLHYRWMTNLNRTLGWDLTAIILIVFFLVESDSACGVLPLFFALNFLSSST